MTDNSSPKSGDLHIRPGDELLAEIKAMAAADMRNWSDIARVLLAEAVAARRAREALMDTMTSPVLAAGPAYTVDQQTQIRTLVESGRSEDLLAAQRLILDVIKKDREDTS